MSQRDYKLVPFCVHGCQITQDRYLFSILREPSVDRKDLQALTLMVLTRDNPVLDPLAVLHRLYIFVMMLQGWMMGKLVIQLALDKASSVV